LYNTCGPQKKAPFIMQSSPQAGIHGPSHSGVDKPPLAGALEFGAGVLAAAQADAAVAEGSLGPKPYAVDPHYNAAPILSACVAGDVLSAVS
jgi:hypothetical protein